MATHTRRALEPLQTLAAPENKCCQITTTEGVGLRPLPCHSDTVEVDGRSINNTIIQYLSRGSNVEYYNTDSKQVSRCGPPVNSPGAGTLALCWIQVKAGVMDGFIPISRGSFDDAFCTSATDPSSTENLVEFCGEMRMSLCSHRASRTVCRHTRFWRVSTPHPSPSVLAPMVDSVYNCNDQFML